LDDLETSQYHAYAFDYSNRKIPPTRLPQGKMLSCINLVPKRGVRETSQRQ